MKNSFLLKKYFACTVFALFFSACIFVYCRISYFSRFAAEAGMKGEMSHFLDAPDA